MTEPTTDADHARKMWQAVILLAVEDALLTGAENVKERHKADSWLRGMSKNFRLVCSLAGMDPDFIRDAYVAGRIDVKILAGNRKQENAA